MEVDVQQIGVVFSPLHNVRLPDLLEESGRISHKDGYNLLGLVKRSAPGSRLYLHRLKAKPRGWYSEVFRFLNQGD